MDIPDPYNNEVRACFANPVHAGEPDGLYSRIVRGSAEESARGARLALAAGIDDGKVRALRFRAWGCPHLVAAAELYCREHEGLGVEALGSLDIKRMMARLAIPVEKTGRLLLLEDAARRLAEAADGKED